MHTTSPPDTCQHTGDCLVHLAAPVSTAQPTITVQWVLSTLAVTRAHQECPDVTDEQIRAASAVLNDTQPRPTRGHAVVMTREERHTLALVVDAVAEQAHLQGWADDGRYPMQLLAASVLAEGARGLLACHGQAVELIVLETLAARLARGHWMAATARMDGSGYALPLDSFPSIHLSKADAVAQVRRNAPYFSHGFVVTAGHIEQIFPEAR